MSHHQNPGQNQNIRLDNELFENVAKFKYLGVTLTNQNDVHDEIKSRINPENVCYHSVQNLLSCHLKIKKKKKKKKLKIKIYMGHLQSSRTYLITLSQNFVEMP
jgi:hypothetical protein